ncbi:MAG: glycosyltransferase [Thermodesulfobacteriota bacterium]|nr:glycosyltransferase [Thermodesulfobacteriota bacterium]
MQSMKADLHVHSKYSTRPSYWILQKLGCSESYVEPETVYRIAKQKGMRFVTITDHNTIAGSLEIAHLPDTFISEEITTYFPDNGCKIHVLAYDITESQHEDISRARSSIYDLAAYLKQQAITHVVAHPMFAVNDRLTADQFEQLLLMFSNFELNGTRDGFQNTILLDILTHLTPEQIGSLADKHNIHPAGRTPWKKGLTGGSDDHSGFHVARTFTLVEKEGGLADFLAAVDAGESRVCGTPYHPEMLAHTLYSIAYQFYSNKFSLDRFRQKDRFVGFVYSVLGGPETGDRTATTAAEATENQGPPLENRRPAGSRRRTVPGMEKTLSGFCLQTAREVLENLPEFKRIAAGETLSTGEKVSLCHDFVNQAADEILARLCNTAMEQISSGNIFNLFQMIGAGGALYAMLAPYFISYNVFTKDRMFCKTISDRLRGAPLVRKRVRVGHFTDTLHDINGVARTLRQQAETAALMNKEMILITCGPAENRPGFKTFSPIDTFDVPEYSELKLYYPPLLQMIDYCFDQEINRIHIATPGPVGLAALAIARILQLPTYGTYHTSFPQYVRQMTADAGLEDMTWKYMVWFYSQMDIVFVPSRATGDELAGRGIAREKIRFYSRGIDTVSFHPAKRNGFFKRRFNLADNRLKLLYAGRVSREKNLDQLVEIMRALVPVHPDICLVVVGDGPYLAEMKSLADGLPIVFTGYLDGEDLSEAYAGSDLFVFPSDTDTFGNVVLEAQASGIPVIVTDKGGPAENMVPDETGFIVPAGDIAAFTEKISRLVEDPVLLARMKRNARAYMENRSFESAFESQWNLYHEPVPGCTGLKAAFFNN